MVSVSDHLIRRYHPLIEKHGYWHNAIYWVNWLSYWRLWYFSSFCCAYVANLQCTTHQFLPTFAKPSVSCFWPTEIGLGLTGFGVLFSLLGIIMLFDKGFLAMGNVMIHPHDWFWLQSSLLFTDKHCCLPCCQILFVSGVLLTIGLKPTVQFFTKPKNHKVLILSLQNQSCFSSICISS